MFGFGFALRLERAAAVPSAAISSLEVLGAAPLPDGADAAVPDGWVAKAVLPDDGVSTFDPKKIALTVSDPGFDTVGEPVVRTRTVTGTAVVRRQYPNNAQRLNSESDGTRTVYFALSDVIYAGSSVSASAAAGYYGAAAAGAVPSSNSSTLAYPMARFGWANIQHERVAGATMAVEAFAYHRHAMNGQQVACVKLLARDAAGTSLSPEVTVTAPELSSLQTGGNIAEAWKATIDLANIAQGDLAQVNARVFPWIGDASAVLDTSDAAEGAQGTVTAGSHVDVPYGATPLRFLCDKTGAYGGLAAWVKAGASGGAVGSNATPYPTVQAALAGLASANVAKGHADHSGSTVWLMDDGGGGAVDHVIGASSATVAGKCFTDIRVDPAATGQVRATLTASVATADLIRWRCPIVIATTGAAAFSGTNPNVRRIAFDGCPVTYSATPTTPLVVAIGLAYWRNCSFAGATVSPFYTFSNNRSAPALVLGNSGTFTGGGGSARALAPYVCVGNSFEGLNILEFPAAHANAFAHDGGILANNRLLKQTLSNLLAQDRALANFARVQNVFEVAGVASVACWGIGNDGKTVAVSEFLSMHNTLPGVGSAGGSNVGRQNACYADVTGAAGISKTMTELFELLHNRNVKADTFTGNTPGTVTNSGRTGTWRYRYGVGNVGNVVVTGDAQSALASAPSESGAGTNGNWTGEVWEAGSVLAAGEANVGFVDNKAGTAGAGGGDYRLSGAGNLAIARVPAGRAVLRYDLAGVARRNDGTGAAGTYERAV